MIKTKFPSDFTLINCPTLESKENYTFSSAIPLGIAYLAAYLRENNINVTLIDALGEGINKVSSWNDKFKLIGLTFDQIITKIPAKTDIIGISANMTAQRDVYFKLIEKIRKNYPKKIIVVGGNDCTCYPDKYLNKSVDYVISNEGEIALSQLIKNINNDEEIKKINGLVYKNKEGKIITQPFFAPNSNLDKLPFPARDLLPLQNYWKKKRSHGPVNGRYTPIISSRGCPFDCSFCSSKVFWKRKWNYRSVKNFISEIEHCIKKYNITHFEIEDDNLTLNINRFEEILNMIIKKKLKISWSTPNGIRSENLSYLLLEKMKKSGCVHLAIAPESGSKRILNKIYNKKINLDKMVEVVKNCSKIRIKLCAFFIVGLPDESKKDRIYTLKYIIKLAKYGLDEVGVFPCIPLPRTQIRQKYFSHLNQELIDKNLISGEVPSWYPNRKEVKKYIRNLYLAFLITKLIYHPFKVIGSFTNIIMNRQTLKTEREVIRRLDNIKNFYNKKICPESAKFKDEKIKR